MNESLVLLYALPAVAFIAGFGAAWFFANQRARGQLTEGVDAVLAGATAPEWATPLVSTIEEQSQALALARQQLTDAQAQLDANEAKMATVSSHDQMKSGQLQQACTSLKSLVGALESVSATAQQTLQIALQNQSESSTQRAALKEAVGQVRRISGSTSQALQEIQALDTRSEKIQSVTRVINDIAEQTGLLSLNAAIEAARAGEQGRGFAVVADEVRNLAGRTSHATEEVNGIVEEMARGTRSVVEQIDQLSNEVEEGSNAIRAIDERLSEIGSRAGQVGSQLENLMQEIQSQLGVVQDTCASLEQMQN